MIAATEPLSSVMCDNPVRTGLFRAVINDHHSYMDYKDTCNRRINWLVYRGGTLIAAIGINSAILCLSARDQWVGWDKTQRLRKLNSVANNYRFCLIRGDCLKNDGTRVLKLLRSISPPAWEGRYGDKLVLLETLVKPPWGGGVYLGDNWSRIGMTKGFSFSKAPLKSWQKENSTRGELARTDPAAAILKYAVGGKHYSGGKSEPKIIFVKTLRDNALEFLNATI